MGMSMAWCSAQVERAQEALLGALQAAVELMAQADERGGGTTQQSSCATRVAFAHAVRSRAEIRSHTAGGCMVRCRCVPWCMA